jgi:hypothetical protein
MGGDRWVTDALYENCINCDTNTVQIKEVTDENGSMSLIFGQIGGAGLGQPPTDLGFLEGGCDMTVCHLLFSCNNPHVKYFSFLKMICHPSVTTSVTAPEIHLKRPRGNRPQVSLDTLEIHCTQMLTTLEYFCW